MLVGLRRTTAGMLKRFADWAYMIRGRNVARELVAGDIEVQRRSNDFLALLLAYQRDANQFDKLDVPFLDTIEEKSRDLLNK